MPVIRYVASVMLYLLMLPISTPAAFIVSTWTRPDDLDWGGWFGTYDNPPQGDRKWLKDHPELTGWRGYLNRVGWIRRNRLYGLKRFLAVDRTDHKFYIGYVPKTDEDCAVIQALRDEKREFIRANE